MKELENSPAFSPSAPSPFIHCLCHSTTDGQNETDCEPDIDIETGYVKKTKPENNSKSIIV